MASPSSLVEPVKILSTATTTLWLLVPSICSCMDAIFLLGAALSTASMELARVLVVGAVEEEVR